MFTKLLNPKTDTYRALKDIVLSDSFQWFYTENKDKFGFYSHVFLERPGIKLYPRVMSEHSDLFECVLREIFEVNNIKAQCIYRMNANAVHSQRNILTNVFHHDHEFDHKNILLYLTSAGGDTLTPASAYRPMEDDVVTFSGLHCHQTPVEGRRIVLVATYLDGNS